jgi:integrase
MPLSSRPTLRESTKVSYLRRARDLLRQCRKELGIPPHARLDYRQLVGWMITKKPEWSRPTWRQYKASVLFFLGVEQSENEPGIGAMAADAADILTPEEANECLRTTRRTSGAKKKRFPLSDYKKLLQSMAAHKSQWAQDTERWVGATYLTGLRPTEWRGSALVTITVAGVAVPALQVRNAKNSNQRAHGEFRHLILDALTQPEIQLLSEHIARAREWDQAGQYSVFQRGCAAALAQAHRRLWPRRVEHATLYSVRHQFAANAKASGLTREELAALMGHASNDTATQHYGRKKAGVELVRVRAHPDEVAKIRRVYTAMPPAPHPEPVVRPGASPSLRPSGLEDGR